MAETTRDVFARTYIAGTVQVYHSDTPEVVHGRLVIAYRYADVCLLVRDEVILQGDQQNLRDKIAMAYIVSAVKPWHSTTFTNMRHFVREAYEYADEALIVRDEDPGTWIPVDPGTPPPEPPDPEGWKFPYDKVITQAIGGFKVGDNPKGFTNTQMWDRLMFPPQNPAVTLSVVPANTNPIELGNPITTGIRLTAGVTIGTAPIASLNFRRDGAIIHTAPVPTANGNVVFDYVGAVNTTTTFSVDLMDDGGNTVSASRTYTFTYPSYYGVTGDSARPPASTILTGLTKRVAVKAAFGMTFSANSEYPIIAYPASWGAIADIKEALMGLSILSSFTRFDMSFTMLDGNVVPYFVYVQGDRILTASPMTYNISF